MTPNALADVEYVYPESDGKPMADNGIQFRWIKHLADNLEVLFASREDVFVGGNLFWYPVERDSKTVQAPDVFVVFGRPKGDRPSYVQHLEGGVPMAVVFEVLSPSNTVGEMLGKLDWYEKYGVQEYYVYDPEADHLVVYRRERDTLVGHAPAREFVSPLLGVRFDLSGEEMAVHFPDGRPFLSMPQLDELRRLEKARADDEKARADDAEEAAAHQKQRADDADRAAADQKQRADDAKARADDEKRRADDEKARADDEKQRADDEKRRADDEKQTAADQKARADLAELDRDSALLDALEALLEAKFQQAGLDLMPRLRESRDADRLRAALRAARSAASPADVAAALYPTQG